MYRAAYCVYISVCGSTVHSISSDTAHGHTLQEAIARPVKKQKQEAGAEAPKQQHTRQPSLQQLQGQQQQQPAQQHQPDSNTKAGMLRRKPTVSQPQECRVHGLS